ncbi:MAG: SGNH/GDSL hydrolase family protein [Fimbriimonadaceae bacterium]|nr:SGNH/GDSL hydrolase family protein [Chitinophagales bacterium]
MKTIIILLAACISFSNSVKAQADVSKLPPLDELGKGTYEGFVGGLYPNGSNEMPAAFYNDAVVMANSVEPLDASGKISEAGKIGLVTIGASTVAMFSEGIEKAIYNTPGLRDKIVFVNGGIGGQDLNKIYDQNAKYWQVVSSRVIEAGLTDEQVQVVWFQEDDLKNQTSAFPDRAEMLADEFTYAIQKMKERYPNLKFVYLTGRHTTDYMPADAKAKHQEPRAYLNGWASKVIIERQINGDAELNYKGTDVKAPMIIWGPYFWTQGNKPRKDGYYFSPDLAAADGVHPTDAGKQKVARDILDFWAKDPVSQLWFLENPDLISAIENIKNEDVQNDIQYLKFYILNQKMEETDLKNITGNIRVLILEDTVVIADKTFVPADSIAINELKPAMYKYLIKDDGAYTRSGKFMVEDDYTITKLKNDKTEKRDRLEIDTTKKQNLVGPDEPAWFINGNNKLPKLVRLLGGDKYAKAIFTTPDGKVVLEVEDVLKKHTNVNAEIPSGEYILKFYDENGKQIDIERAIPEYLKIH